MRASFWNFSFWYFHFGNFSSLQSYCGNRKINYRFFQITRFKERKNMAVELPVITWKKKHLSEQIVSFRIATFEGL